MTDEDMKQLIQDIMEAQYEADRFSDDLATRATAHPPATSEELERLRQHLTSRGLSLPPSFAQFLRIHNGIADFLPSMELSLRSADMIEGACESDTEWKHISPAHRFVFASGDTAAFAGFVPDTADEQGEMRIVMVTESAETTEYDNFEEFLSDQLDYYNDVINAERADRAHLKDD